MALAQMSSEWVLSSPISGCSLSVLGSNLDKCNFQVCIGTARYPLLKALGSGATELIETSAVFTHAVTLPNNKQSGY